MLRIFEMRGETMKPSRQAVVTVASGQHTEILDRTFTSFGQNPFLELHAFILGERLPQRQLPGIVYHLREPDPTYQHFLREIYYRRFALIDELDCDYALIVDNHDVLCLQPIPEIPALLRGAAVGACVEHAGGKYIAGQGYTSSYVNAGVTFWNIAASRRIRADVVARGRARFRSIEDQLTLNEVVHTRYYDDLILLPCQYNYRPCLAPTRVRGWPTVSHLDGVRIYHNVYSLDAARKLIPVAARAALETLPPDGRALTPFQRFRRRVQHRLFYRHQVR
ncbi:MAG TPA: hypothetical protein PKK20_04415 [Verrucomicrobiota bacterium]|jgi:hypothetical protein|nr:hypothetical protein [Verrucomicrobiota bacterium]NMD21636.1 hypothetical protein [Verrucomicrobiota bacterium]HNU99161.1 hypothetical protein [Verrucomicrobiota bacterium]HOA61308.1 hypothetical protein [Verrucomicrobiota bacterium]HOG87388.1 hypothetical protein [Verrucomicrobiota bacterium]